MNRREGLVPGGRNHAVQHGGLVRIGDGWLPGMALHTRGVAGSNPVPPTIETTCRTGLLLSQLCLPRLVPSQFWYSTTAFRLRRNGCHSQGRRPYGLAAEVILARVSAMSR